MYTRDSNLLDSTVYKLLKMGLVLTNILEIGLLMKGQLEIFKVTSLTQNAFGYRVQYLFDNMTVPHFLNDHKESSLIVVFTDRVI